MAEPTPLSTHVSSRHDPESSEDPPGDPGGQNLGDQKPSERVEIENEAEALHSASEPTTEEEEETLFEVPSSNALESTPPQLTIEHTVSESDERRCVLIKAHLYCLIGGTI